MKPEKNMSDQSMLWGVPLAVLDLWGVRLMFAGFFVGALALAISLASAFILYRVADTSQKDLERGARESKDELGQQKLKITEAEARIAEAGAVADRAKADASIANEKAANLEKEAEQQRKETAEAHKGAAEANKVAAEAKLELAKFKAPRWLHPEQQQRISAKVGAFAGTKYDFGIGPSGDPEPQLLLEGVEDALTAAGWLEIAWRDSWPGAAMYDRPGKPRGGLVTVSNIIVVYPNGDTQVEAAANALGKALQDEGLVCWAKQNDETSNASTNMNAHTIHLMIGRKL